MGAEQRTPISAYSCSVRFGDSVDQDRTKFTYGYNGATLSLLAGVGTNILEAGDIIRCGGGCK